MFTSHFQWTDVCKLTFNFRRGWTLFTKLKYVTVLTHLMVLQYIKYIFRPDAGCHESNRCIPPVDEKCTLRSTHQTRVIQKQQITKNNYRQPNNKICLVQTRLANIETPMKATHIEYDTAKMHSHI